MRARLGSGGTVEPNLPNEEGAISPAFPGSTHQDSPNTGDIWFLGRSGHLRQPRSKVMHAVRGKSRVIRIDGPVRIAE